MSNNLDTVLSDLAREVNELEVQRTAGNQGKQIEMGHKLIAIRQILREVNGERSMGTSASDGHSPNGWGLWVKENLSISHAHVKLCIQSALNIEHVRAKIGRNKQSPAAALRAASRGWPTWTREQREQFSAGVLQLLRAA